MNIDFHYGIIYAVSRLAGMSAEQAKIIAHACQYVDDATTPGILEFEGGETFERFASAHELFDYHNVLNAQNRLVWVPFHFLPGGVGESLEEKSVCKPDSAIAKAMVRKSILAREQDNALHRLGVTLHVYVDTWAHQGFSGTVSKYNQVTHLHGDDHDEQKWLGSLKSNFSDISGNVKSEILDAVCNLGHGAALHFPDMPWATWEYINGHGETLRRNNLTDFVSAADMACRAIQGFLNRNVQFEAEPGLPENSRNSLMDILGTQRDHDEKTRLKGVLSAISRGAVPGIREDVVEYIPKGVGSWKHVATGISDSDDGGSKPVWSQQFEDSNYRKFHDAVKEHRFSITQDILPKFGIRLA